MNMKWFKMLAVASAVFLSGCFSPGERREVKILVPHLEDGRPAEVITAVVNDAKVPKAFVALDKAELSYMTKGKPTDAQKVAVASVEKGCREYARLDNPHPIVDTAISGVFFGGLGYLRGGAAADSFDKTKPIQYSRYIGTLDLFGGAGSGFLNSGNKRYASFELCGYETFNLAPRNLRVLR